ncbi:MAG: flagellar FlbD family protein [Planctomycetota bacterium]|jgi:flagellar protein FlbD
MITLTKLNGEELMVHAVHIESVERGVDTRVTLTNGKQLFVRETPEEVRTATMEWFRAIGGGALPINESGFRRDG